MTLGGSELTGGADLGGRTSDRTAHLARQWVDCWTRGDLDDLDALLAGQVTIECNLGWPATREALLDTIVRLSAELHSTMILSLTATESRAAVLTDCRVFDPSGSIRVAEFLEVTGDRIRGIRRVFDLTAVGRLLPNLPASLA